MKGERGVKTRLFKAVFLALLFLASCRQSDWARRIEWPEFSFEQLPSQADYPDYGAVIILDEGNLEIIGGQQIAYTLFEKHRVVKIFNQSGYRFANVAIPYTPSSQIDKIEARTISADGRVTVLKEENIFDVTLYPEFIFYSDQRAKIFTFPAVEPNCIIEYRYELAINNHTLMHNWVFQDFAPTLRSRFHIRVPSEWDLKYRIYNSLIEPQIAKTPGGFKSTYSWEARDVAALESEFAMPPLKEVELRLAFSPVGFKTWQDVAGWYRRLSEPQIKANKGVKELALKLTTGIEEKSEKIKILYEWVRDNIRYIAVAIGMGSYQPHPAEEALINRYGDCKDMTTLLCAMARAVDIEMYPALVSTQPNGQIDTSLASPFQFNHAIACCPKDSAELWLDATRKGCPFGSIPWYNQGMAALIIAEAGKEKLVFIPVDSINRNVSATEWQIELDEAWRAHISGRSSFSGALAADLRELFAWSQPGKVRQWLEQFVAQKCASAKIDSFSMVEAGKSSDPFIMDYHLKANDFLLPQQDLAILSPLAFFEMSLLKYFPAEKRQHALSFSYEFTNSFALNVQLPAGWAMASPPQSDSLFSEFGSALWRSANVDQGFELLMKLNMRGSEIKSGDYISFKKFLSEVRILDLRNIILKRKLIE